MQDRYSRQIRFAALGERGQERLLASRVGIVGCGALGTASADMLARAGVGRIRIIDRDFVEASNLQRQTLFSESDARQRLPKAEAARRALSKVNSEIEVEAWSDDLDYRNVAAFAEGCDLLIDGTDNFETRFLINDWAVSHGVPWIYGAALGSYGVSAAIDAGGNEASADSLSTIPSETDELAASGYSGEGRSGRRGASRNAAAEEIPVTTPCLRCLMEELPAAGSAETCETAGILGPVVQAVASFQVSQTLRHLSGKSFVPVMLRVDVWEGYWRSSDYLALKNPDCPCCGKGQFPFLKGESGERSARLCGRNAVQIRPSRPASGSAARRGAASEDARVREDPAAENALAAKADVKIDFDLLEQRLPESVEVRRNPYLMRLQVDGHEIHLFPDGRAIITGTDDIAQARSLYARYIGS